MKQEVNLLSQLELKPKVFFTVKRLLQVITIWVLLLLLIYTIEWFLFIEQGNFLAKSKSEKEQLTKQLVVVNKKLVSYTSQGKIKAAQVKTDFAVSSLNVESRFGFSEYFSGLATITPPNIWLTRIIISNVSNSIELDGKAVAITFIPEFIHNLSKQKVFLGKRFDVLHIAKDKEENKKGEINFILETGMVSTS